MPGIFDIFQIGARALFAQQRRISTAGHNIANASTEGFSRQRVNMTTTIPFDTPQGQLGNGVRISGILRIRNEILDRRIRNEVSTSSYNQSLANYYSQMETAFYDPLVNASEIDNPGAAGGIANLIDKFFAAAQELSLQPDSMPLRVNFVEEAKTLSTVFQTSQSDLTALRENLNEQVIGKVGEINALIDQIAELNNQVMGVEIQQGVIANDLRDRRDLLVEELAEKVNIQTYAGEFGVMNVEMLGVNVVDTKYAIHLETIGGDVDPNGFVQVRFSGEPSRVLTSLFHSGELGAALEMRDDIVQAYMDELDTLAGSLIEQVNNIYAGGSGTAAYQSLISDNAVSDSAEPFSNAGLNVAMQAGQFSIRVLDSSGEEVETYTIDFDPSVDSLEDLAQRIDAIDSTVGGGHLTTSTDQGRLSIFASTGFEFQFEGDSSNVLSALGVNTLFSGSNASDISVNTVMEQNPDLVATSANGEIGDNSIIASIAELKGIRGMSSGTQTFGEFYRSTVGRIGIEGRRAAQTYNGSTQLLSVLSDQRSSVSGVSLDEEMIDMLQAQQAYTAAARLVTTVDEMLELIVSRLGLVGR